MTVVDIENDRPLVLLDVVIVIDIQRIGELGLQTRITLSDIEGIGVISDVEQLGHLRLTGIATVMYPDVLLVTEFIVEIEGWREIGHITDGIDIHPTIVLNEVRMLWLHQESHIIIVFLLPVTQGQTDVVGIVLVLRITAEVTVKIVVKGRNATKPGIPLAILWHDRGKGVDRHTTEIVGLTVALILTVTQLIVGLKVGTLPKRLAIEDAQHIALIV